MFEGKPPLAPLGRASDRDSGQSANLRELTWADLRARLEAASDLKASMNHSGDHPKASFDAGFASRVASCKESKEAVNPEDLANGKGSWLNSGATHSADQSVSRGNS